MAPFFDYETAGEAMPIAVVGIGCRFPGDASSAEKLWDMAVKKQSAKGEVPADRFNIDAFYHPQADKNGTMNNRGGFFLQEDIAAFDAPFFSISPAEAISMDPLQRLLLEVTYEALESAGIPLCQIAGSNTGCYVGNFFSDYDQISKKDPELLSKYHLTGVGQAILSNRLSYSFGLVGPSLTLDTACSSSLIALHLACQSLRTGETEAAIVGATNAILNPDTMIGMTNLHFLSPDSECHTFDKKANGYARGEGMAALVLKPLERAVADNDNIRAVIRGTSANSIGSHSGITVPKKEAQIELIKKAYSMAGCDPAVTAFCETHGTGTQAGDPVEVGAIGEAFGPTRPAGEEQRLYIGSVKTNIGHLEGASGLAGVVKAIKSLETGIIPPNVGFDVGNPAIDFERYKVRVPVEPVPWPTSGIRRVSVNSFGYGGSNGHVIMDDALHYMQMRGINGRHSTSNQPSRQPPLSLERRDSDSDTSSVVSSPDLTTSGVITPTSSVDKPPPNRPRSFPFSSHEASLTQENIRKLGQHLLSSQIIDESSFLDDLCFTLAERRSSHGHSAALTASSVHQLIELCQKPVPIVKRKHTPPKLGFVFTGQGAQWWAMGRELLSNPVFVSSLESCSHVVKSLGGSWSLMEELVKDQKSSRVNEAEISQPLCTALQIALVELLKSWNIYPSSVVGHSSGEIAAAYATGALTLESAIQVAYLRGLLSPRVKSLGFMGAMLAVGCSEEDAVKKLQNMDTELGTVKVACINSPRSVTLSGDTAAINHLLTVFNEQAVFARKLPVETAYHSHHMESVAGEYLNAMKDLTVVPWDQRRPVSMFSSVYGRPITRDDDLGAAYWVENMVSSVRFSGAVSQLCQQDGTKDAANICTLIELGPHSALAGPVKQILASLPQGSKGFAIAYLSVLIREKPPASGASHTAISVAGSLFAAGYPVNMHKVNFPESYSQTSPTVLHNLPSYSWNHTRKFWYESRLSKDYRFRQSARTDVLGAPCSDWNPLAPRWRNFIRLSEQPWVKGHVIQGAILYPAAGFCCMAIEAAAQTWKASMSNNVGTTHGPEIADYVIRSMRINRALVVPDTEEGVEVIFSLLPESREGQGSSWREFRIHSYTHSDGWAEHCSGSVSAVPQGNVAAQAQRFDDGLSLVREECRNVILRSRLYKHLDKVGLTYGPEFQGILKVTAGNSKAYGTVRVTDTTSGMPHKFEFPRSIHPATLDTFLQMSIAAITGGDLKNLRQPYVPTGIAELRISGTLTAQTGNKLSCYASSQYHGLRDIVSTIHAGAEDGKSFVNMKGVNLISLQPSETGEAPEIKSHTAIVSWQPDVDLIAVDKMNKLLQASAPDEESSPSYTIREREFLSYYFFVKTLKSIDDNDIAAMHSHQQKFVRYMKHQIDLVAAHAHEQQTPEWSQLDEPVTAHRIEKLLEAYSRDDTNSTISMFLRMGHNLESILKGKSDTLTLMMDGDLLFKYYTAALGTKRTYPQIQKYISLLAHKHPNLEYLEIGAGTGGCTEHILQRLAQIGGFETPALKSYTFTDISTGFLDKAEDKFSDFGHVMQYAKLDIEKDPGVQAGFDKGRKFDVIVAANVLHATYDIDKTMRHVRQLLRPGGKLILLDMTHSVMSVSLIFGNLAGWWNCSEPWRDLGPLLTEAQWADAFQKAGFTGLQASTPDVTDPLEEQTRFMVATAIGPEVTSRPDDTTTTQLSKIVVIKAADTSTTSKLHEDILAQLETVGVPLALCTLESSLEQDLEGAAVVNLMEIDESILNNISETGFKAVKRVVNQSAGVFWLTKGHLCTTATRPEMSLFPGLARSLRVERQDIPIVTIDLDQDSASVELAQSLFIIFQQALSLVNGESTGRCIIDREFSERDGLVHIKRSLENRTLNNLVAAKAHKGPIQPVMQDLCEMNQPLRSKVLAVGQLDSVVFEHDSSLAALLPPDVVDIKVHATALERRDALICSGDVPDTRIGTGCAGVVSAVGSAVKHVAVGDRVLAFAEGSLATQLRAHPSRLQVLPTHMSFQTAAAIPVTGVTACFAFSQIAKIGEDVAVLITGAMSPTGQFALQLAKNRGADVFALVNSDEEVTRLQDTYELPRNRIFSNATFRDHVGHELEGWRMNVVLSTSPLSADILHVIQHLTSPFGSFIQISGNDSASGAPPFMGKNVTVTDLDIHTLFQELPDKAAEALRQATALVEDGKIQLAQAPPAKPLSLVGVVLDQVKSTTDKVIIQPCEGDMVKVMPEPLQHIELDPNATYLLSGGLGGLGRSIARWMVDRGALHLMFTSRYGAKSNDAVALLSELSRKKVTTTVLIVDVADEDKLSKTLSASLEELPPLRGVIQCAMVLRDQLFVNMPHSDWVDSIRPKVQGSWALHKATLPYTLDFFVMLASCVGFVGNPGQSNYVAGDNYQVALAAHRQALGLPAVTIDVGKIENVGFIAEDSSGVSDRNLTKLGFTGISPAELLILLEAAVSRPAGDRQGDMPNGHFLTGITSTNGDSELPFWYYDPVFAHMDFVRLRHYKTLQKAGSVSQALEVPLATRVASATSTDDALYHILEGIQQKLAKSLQMALEDIDPELAIATYGVDSLVAVDIRNWFLRELKTQVPVFQILQAKSVRGLADKVATKCPLMLSIQEKRN